MSASGPDGVNETASSVTILDRLVGAGIDEERARAWLAEGSVRIAGEPVTTPRRSLRGQRDSR